jgi:hypothetical protein
MENYIDAIKELAYLPKSTASEYMIELIGMYKDEYEVSFEEAYSDLTGVYIDAVLRKI